MSYSTYTSNIRELSETDGVFTTAQAKRFGIPADALSYACRTGRLERVSQGAYRLIGSQPTQLDELSAAWKLTSPEKMSFERIPFASWDGIAIGGTTAASIIGIGDFYLSPYRIFAPRRINSRNTSVRFGVREIAREDVAFIGGLPVTRAERTLLDLCIDKEDPSLIAKALSDCARRFTGSFSFGHLKSLFVSTFGADKGMSQLEALLADAGIERKAYDVL